MNNENSSELQQIQKTGGHTSGLPSNTKIRICADYNPIKSLRGYFLATAIYLYIDE